MNGRLNDRSALVTGGASGLGKAIAQRLLAEGARVVITDIQAELGRAVAAECGFAFLEQNVCEESDWVNVMRALEGWHGKLEILVNNAGILGPMDAVTPESTRLADWRRIFSVNVEGVFLGCRAAIPAMRRTGGGSIVNISSIAGLLATPDATAYGASKAAVRQLTKSVAQYCAQEGVNVRCNSVHPGNVMDSRPDQHASMWQKHALDTAKRRGVSVEEIIADEIAASPMGELAHPEDIAAAVAFLASDDARHITGVELIVDCGTVNCGTNRQSPRAQAVAQCLPGEHVGNT